MHSPVSRWPVASTGSSKQMKKNKQVEEENEEEEEETEEVYGVRYFVEYVVENGDQTLERGVYWEKKKKKKKVDESKHWLALASE